MTTRLFALIARDARVGVVFRRGPTKQVLLIRWDLAADSFEAGQWLKGRVYERRCDLSPSGDRLVYFAATHRPPLQTWTAISRPPYFTAVALWPKGDAWGGGGRFETENRVLLNHPRDRMALHDGLRLPRAVDVDRLPYGGAGEDDPIFSERRLRDGWSCDQEGQWDERASRGRVAFRMAIPDIWSRRQPRSTSRFRLSASVLGLGERQGSWYIERYAVTDGAGEVCLDLGRLDWADWDHNGDLVYARAGSLYRIAAGPRASFDPATAPRRLIDLSDLTFVERKPVPAALQWRGERPVGLALRRVMA
jgi:hypothetical protein